jgi:hypothetical protein
MVSLVPRANAQLAPKLHVGPLASHAALLMVTSTFRSNAALRTLIQKLHPIIGSKPPSPLLHSAHNVHILKLYPLSNVPIPEGRLFLLPPLSLSSLFGFERSTMYHSVTFMKSPTSVCIPSILSRCVLSNVSLHPFIDLSLPLFISARRPSGLTEVFVVFLSSSLQDSASN